MPQSLLSERTVARWVQGGGTPVPYDGLHARESAFYHRVKDTWGLEAAEELDDIIGEEICAEQARVLTYVGTLLVHHGHTDLWQQVYETVALAGLKPGDDTPQRFLEQQMAALRSAR